VLLAERAGAKDGDAEFVAALSGEVCLRHGRRLPLRTVE
jgi:hypothetical protein